MDALIIFCAKYLVIGIGLIVAAYWAFAPRSTKIELALVAIGALPLAYAAARLAGLFFSHPQPFSVHGYEPLIPHEIDNSFPSDHAGLAGAMAGMVSLYSRWLGVVLWVLALLVAAGRMLAGLHYPVDVVVGLMLGGLSAMAAFAVVHAYFRAREHTGA